MPSPPRPHPSTPDLHGIMPGACSVSVERTYVRYYVLIYVCTVGRLYVRAPVRIGSFFVRHSFLGSYNCSNFKSCMRVMSVWTKGAYKNQDMMVHMSRSTDFGLMPVSQD